ncbi:MAG: DUF4843 domain-containing protein [Odoribacteraceae bacterium]|jgi:hypothetical protein|nr:DUF4843 domain-containing protein [Odoribacteraceae bacterium]
MKRYLLPIAALLLAIAACQRDHITVYDADNYVHFARRFVDSSSFSFVSYPTDNEYNYPVVVSLIGKAANRDRAYNVDVIDNYTTAPAANYALPATFAIKANAVADTFYVKLVKTPDLQSGSIRLALRVSGSDELLVGETERTVFVLWYTDRITRPSWWDSTMESAFLGRYSDSKYRLFIQVTGVGDMTGMEYYDKRYYTLIFKNWLREQAAAGHTVYEDDNFTVMSVALIGG